MPLQAQPACFTEPPALFQLQCVQALSLAACLQGDASEAKGSQPEAGPYWSLMFEVSESTEKPVNQSSVPLGGGEWPEVVRECVIGALNTKMISQQDQIVSLYHR